MSALENLKKWFDGLPSSEQREVLQFPYGGKALLSEGLYMGPRPGLVQKGCLLVQRLVRLRISARIAADHSNPKK